MFLKRKYRCLNPLDLQHGAKHLTITVHSTQTAARIMAIFQVSRKENFSRQQLADPCVSVTFVFDRSHTPYYAPTNDGPSVIMRRRLSRRARGFCLFTKQHLPRHHYWRKFGSAILGFYGSAVKLLIGRPKP